MLRKQSSGDLKSLARMNYNGFFPFIFLVTRMETKASNVDVKSKKNEKDGLNTRRKKNTHNTAATKETHILCELSLFGEKLCRPPN